LTHNDYDDDDTTVLVEYQVQFLSLARVEVEIKGEYGGW
jgi:hypothetical protein